MFWFLHPFHLPLIHPFLPCYIFKFSFTPHFSLFLHPFILFSPLFAISSFSLLFVSVSSIPLSRASYLFLALFTFFPFLCFSTPIYLLPPPHLCSLFVLSSIPSVSGPLPPSLSSFFPSTPFYFSLFPLLQ